MNLPSVDPVGVTDKSPFDERIRAVLAAAGHDGEACALVLVNILSMNDTIETFGELATGSVMRSLVSRLTRLARTSDIVGRVGEHQLGLLLRGVRSHGEAMRVAEMVHDSLVDPPFITPGGEVVASVACGVAFSRPRNDPIDLIERASAAMVGATVAPTARPLVSATMDDFRVGLIMVRCDRTPNPLSIFVRVSWSGTAGSRDGTTDDLERSTPRLSSTWSPTHHSRARSISWSPAKLPR